MAKYFFDTSAITKHYHQELGTPHVESLLAAADATFYITRLAVVEVQSALAKNLRGGLLKRSNFEKLTKRFRDDIRRRRLWSMVRLRVSHYEAAERMVRSIGMSLNLRTLDALQLAVAMSLNTPNEPLTLVCADRSFCSIAAAEGQAVINPETP